MPNTMPHRNILIIVNPAAGQRRRPFFEAVLSELRALGAAITVRETICPGDAESLARRALEEHFDAIVAAGGDGTINEVANGIAGSPQVFAVLPLGTANVMAAELALGTSPAAVARTIAQGTPRPVYFARSGGRVFTLMVGVGIDARVVAGVDLRLKRRLGKLAYAWQTLRELACYRPTLYQVTVDGQRYRAAWVVVAKGRFYGGRYVCAPQAALDRPELQVCLFLRPGRMQLLRYVAALMAGRLCRMRERDYRIIPARALTIAGPEGERMQVDGDVGLPLPASIEMIEDPFWILCPAPACD